jgi:Holliday junction DNA helicase RuvA
MITFLEGIIEEKQPTCVILNVNGVGYEVIITLNTFEDLPSTGDTCRLHTVHHIREDSEQLYGFSKKTEREFFTRLISVSGIGPTLGITILSGMPVAMFCNAVASGDVKLLSSIKGIGKKTAERIIVELKDKVPQFASEVSAGEDRSLSEEDQILSDAVLALVALGFRNSDAYAAVKQVIKEAPDVLTVENIVRQSLSSLQR